MDKPSSAKHALLYAIGCALIAGAASAAVTDISNVPLSSASGSTVLPNLLFTLDDSGSMDSDYNPDYVNDSNTCLSTSGGTTACGRGDPPFEAGGGLGFNGVGYDPSVNYLPALNYDGTQVLASITVTAVPNDAYGIQFTGNTDVTTGITGRQYCNTNSVCKRNGTDTASPSNLVSGADGEGHTLAAGQFPYRTNSANASTAIFGLPEMMSIATFTVAGGTVTATTVSPHGITASDKIFTSIGANCAAITGTPTTTSPYTFQYAGSGSGSGTYRKCVSATWTRPSSGATTTVTVTSNGHGLQTNDQIQVFASTANATGTFNITVSDANTFTYVTGSAPATTTGTSNWVRTALYNVTSNISGPAAAYRITPVEWCSDVTLTNCVEVIPPATPPAGYFPAYVRFCQTREQALAPTLVTGADASGNALCRAKYVNAGALASGISYRFPRYGWFNRDTIQSTVASYARTGRTDCSATSCTYNQEIDNYARWWTYYRTRMQMMKTAAGRAFVSFIGNPTGSPKRPDTLRVGFITINPGAPVSSGKYLSIAPFNRTGGATSQAANWYSKFYAQNPNGFTPLREALSRAGWIYAGKLNTGITAGIPVADDPVLASCQRHYTILTTDGFWNSNAGQTIAGKPVANRDNVDPTLIAPYTQAMVDRATTVTFDGGGSSVTTVTPTSTIQEQFICQEINQTVFSNNTSAVPQQTLCGCGQDEHRIKERDILTGNVVTSVGGLPTTSGTGTVTNFLDFTACTPMLIKTDTTPKTEREQKLCQGNNATTFGNGVNGGAGTFQTLCGCSDPLQHSVIQRTLTYTATQQTRDGVVQPLVNAAYDPPAYTVTTACDAKVDTTVTPKTEQEEFLCSGNAATGFTAGVLGGQSGSQATCGCSTVGTGDSAVIRRTLTYTNTLVQTDGVTTSNTNTPYSAASYTYTAACTPFVRRTRRSPGSSVTFTETQVCTNNQTLTFQDGSNFTCPCTLGNKLAIKATKTNLASYDTFTTNGAANTPPPVVTGGGATTFQWSNGGAFNNLPVTFASCDPTPAAAAGPSASGGNTNTTTLSQVTAANLVITPQGTRSTTNGAPTLTSTGSTVGAGQVTLSPNPLTASGSPTSVNNAASGGSILTIALSPNPKTITGGPITTTTTPGGTADTLSDVALYYYMTDLRGDNDILGDPTGPALNPAGVDVSTNNVPSKSGAKDFVTHQHMTTFTLGLADGLMRYQADYETASTGDFAGIRSKTLGGCFWSGAAYCDWPNPVADQPSALDDLWHAAANGRGLYYQATNATSLSLGLQNTLTALNSQVAAAAASATSSPNVTQTDNQIFSTTYETSTWSGKVFAQTIDPVTGAVNATHQWDADTRLLLKFTPAAPATSTGDTRTIWTFDGSAASKLKSFTWANMTTTQEQNFFQNKCSPLTTMTQCTSLSSNPTLLAIANDGSAMLGFLRGWSVNENNGVFRDRIFTDPLTNATLQTVLGDTISAKPAFVRNPTFAYADAVTPTYASFAASNASRAPLVYVAANDGYLHAFDAGTSATGGDEVWAYAPRFILPGMYALADKGYASAHRFYIDGTPETGDVYDVTAGAWKTILVGGAAGGGRGFYALDVTNPASPKGLWEFCSDSTLCAISDTDLGQTYGNPVIGKRKSDGKWVVVLTSGLNNVSPGTGIGYFYVLDAITGAVLNKVSTGVGENTTPTPSGLMKMSPFLDAAQTDATFQYIYAGDQLGNVWRLDMGATTAAGSCTAPAAATATPPCVTHVATLSDGSTPPRGQPITTRPALTHIGSPPNNRVMYWGTGRYLGNADLTDPGAASGIAWQETIYGFRDKNSDYGDLRTNGNLVSQTLSLVSPGNRGITSNPVDWNTRNGWYVDLNPSADPTPGERVNIDPRLVLGTLVLLTNVPTTGGSCSIGGSSFEYEFDFKTGSSLSTSSGGVVGRSLGGTIAVGMAIVQLPSGAIKDIITGADTSKTTTDVNVSSASASVKRFSYRVR